MITLTINMPNLRTPASFTTREVQMVTGDAAVGVADLIRKNFRRLSKASGSRYYWHEAAASTAAVTELGSTTAHVAVRQKGVRLHWKGGEVRPTGRTSEVTRKPTRNILIPFEDSPLRKRRVTLAEMKYPRDSVHVITSRSGCPILVYADSKKKKTNLIGLGKLVKVAKFEPRAEVIPSQDTLTAAAVKAGRVAINRIMKENRKK